MFGFDSFELNKIAGAVLGTLLATFGLSLLAGSIYAPHRPEKPAFAVAVAEAPATAAPAAAQTKPIAELLKTASAEKGQAVAGAAPPATTLPMPTPTRSAQACGTWSTV